MGKQTSRGREYIYTDDFPDDDAAAAAAVLGGASLTPPGSPGSAGGRNNSTTATKRELRPGSFFGYELALGKAAHVPAGMEAVADCAAYATRHTNIRLYHGGYDSPFGLRLRRALLECLKRLVVATGKEYKHPPKAPAPLVPFDRAIGGRPAGSEAAGPCRLDRPHAGGGDRRLQGQRERAERLGRSWQHQDAVHGAGSAAAGVADRRGWRAPAVAAETAEREPGGRRVGERRVKWMRLTWRAAAFFCFFIATTSP